MVTRLHVFRRIKRTALYGDVCSIFKKKKNIKKPRCVLSTGRRRERGKIGNRKDTNVFSVCPHLSFSSRANADCVSLSLRTSSQHFRVFCYTPTPEKNSSSSKPPLTSFPAVLLRCFQTNSSLRIQTDTRLEF